MLDYINCLLKQILTNKQAWMKQDDEDTGIDINLVPGSYGMNVPSTCTIVIIAGIDIKQEKENIYLFPTQGKYLNKVDSVIKDVG